MSHGTIIITTDRIGNEPALYFVNIMHNNLQCMSSDSHIKLTAGRTDNKAKQATKPASVSVLDNAVPFASKEPKTYRVTLSLPITTSGGAKTAERIFTNLVKGDPNRPLLHLRTKAI